MRTSVVDRFGFFQFAILPVSLRQAVDAIRAQLNAWQHRPYQVGYDRLDVRRVLLSRQGPKKLPAIEKARVVFEVRDASAGVKSLFVSSVADGDNSLLHCLSRRVAGGIIALRMEDLCAVYPMNQVLLLDNFEVRRIVRVMKDERGWDFFEEGPPLWFEDAGNYLSFRKKDRLTPTILEAYLSKLGFVSAEESFWTDSSRTAAYIGERGFEFWVGDANRKKP